jgi:CheY-like chemotaxis protein
MPQMTGPELVKRLRKLNPTQRFFFMSGYASDAAESAESVRSHIILQKPFNLAALARAVRQALGG